MIIERYIRLNYILLFLILATFIIRLPRLDRPLADWHIWRQIEIYSVSYNFSVNQANVFSPKVFRIDSKINNDGLYLYEFPIYELILSRIIKYTGDKLIYLRIFSLFLSIAITFGIYVLGSKTFNKRVGIISAFIYNLLPTSVYWSTSLSHDLFATALFISALGLLVTKRPSNKYIIISSLLLGVSIATKPIYAFYTLSIPFLINLKLIWQKSKTFSVIAFILLIAPETMWLIKRFLTPIHLRDPQSYLIFISGGENYLDFLRNTDFISSIFRTRLLNEITTPFFGYMLILGIVVLIKEKSKFKKFYSSIIILLIAGVFIIAWGNYYHDYYQIPLLPFISILCGYFLDITFLKLVNKNMFILFCGTFLMIYFAYYFWRIPYTFILAGYYNTQVKYSEFKKDIDNIKSLIQEGSYTGIIEYPDVEDDPVILSSLKVKGYNLIIDENCSNYDFVHRLNKTPFNTISYLVIQKDRYRKGKQLYCDPYELAETVKVSSGFKIIYEGEKLILLEKFNIH